MENEQVVTKPKKASNPPQELTLVQEQPKAVAERQTYSAGPAGLLEIAVARGADLAELKELMALKREYEADEARKSHFKAMAEFRKTQIIVMRSETIKDGPLKGKKHAKLFDFVDAATPALSGAGLSATWRIIKDEKDWIEMACIISHEDGHQEQVTMGGPPDTGPGRNAIQARNSTVTYLEKATFKMALGLAERGDDDDGNGGPKSGVEYMTKDHQATVQAKAEEISNTTLVKVLRSYKVSSIKEIPDIEYESIIRRLEITASTGDK